MYQEDLLVPFARLLSHKVAHSLNEEISFRRLAKVLNEHEGVPVILIVDYQKPASQWDAYKLTKSAFGEKTIGEIVDTIVEDQKREKPELALRAVEFAKVIEPNQMPSWSIGSGKPESLNDAAREIVARELKGTDPAAVTDDMEKCGATSPKKDAPSDSQLVALLKEANARAKMLLGRVVVAIPSTELLHRMRTLSMDVFHDAEYNARTTTWSVRGGEVVFCVLKDNKDIAHQQSVGFRGLLYWDTDHLAIALVTAVKERCDTWSANSHVRFGPENVAQFETR